MNIHRSLIVNSIVVQGSNIRSSGLGYALLGSSVFSTAVCTAVDMLWGSDGGFTRMLYANCL